MATKTDPVAAAELKAKWPLNSRVKLNAETARSFPRLSGKVGIVEAYARNGFPKVLFYGRKTSVSWHPDMLTKPRAQPEKR